MTDTETSKKLRKVRTFAQDAEVAKQGGDAKQAAPTTSTDKKIENKSKERKGSEKTPLPIPTKKTSDSDQKIKDQLNTDVRKESINNPPFHQLKNTASKDSSRETKPIDKKKEVLEQSAKKISDKPTSLLSQETTNQVDIDGGDNATILSDTKRQRKTVWQAIAESSTAWFQNFKNTYITPPKPSYTVTKSQRRAGVVTDATTRTGATNVSHDDFAARLRARFAALEEKEDIHTDPVFLPELPPEGSTDAERGIMDIETVPRKNTATNKKIHQKSTKDSEAKPQAISKNVRPDHGQLKNGEPSISDIDSGNVTQDISIDVPAEETDKHAVTEPDPVIVPASEVSAPSKDHPTNTEIRHTQHEAKDTTLSDLDNIPKTNKPIPNKSPDDITGADTDEEPTSRTASASSEESEVLEKADANLTTEESSLTGGQDESVTEDDAVLPVTEEAITEDTEEEIPILDEEEVMTKQQTGDPATNRLTIKIVTGVVVFLLVGYTTFLLVPHWMNDEDSSATPKAIPGSTTQMLLIDGYSSAESRLQAISKIIEENITDNDLLHIPLMIRHETEWHEAIPRLVLNELGLQPTHSFQAIITDMYLGGFQNTHPFIFLRVSDQRAARGGMLEWEGEMEIELAPLFGAVSGSFTDETHSGYDLRILSDEHGPILTYGLEENRVIITTTPETWVEIAQHLQ